MTRAKDISKILTDADLSGTLDVTGTVTAGGLTVQQSGNDVSVQFNNTNNDFTTATSSALRLSTTASDNNLYYGEIKVQENSADTSSTNMLFYPKVNQLAMKLNNNGDISFYEDTGTTPKFFWDASAESLGIGTSSVNGTLHVQANPTAELSLWGGGGSYGRSKFNIQSVDDGTSTGKLQITTESTVPSSPELLTITNAGNVGIGTSSPATKLHLSATDGDSIMRMTRSNSASTGNNFGSIEFQNSAGTVLAGIKGKSMSGNTEGGITFGAGGGNAERMRIDNSGNVGIGTSSPFETLRVAGTVKIAPANQTGILGFGGTANSDIAIGVFRGAPNSTSAGNSLNLAGYDNIVFSVSNDLVGSQTERMRVNDKGLLINTTSTLHSGVERALEVQNHSGSGFVAIFKGNNAGHETVAIHNSATSGTRILLAFKTSGSTGTLVGRITSDGSTTTYATSSDYRLKESITYDFDATTRLKQLKPARFNWIADESNTTVDGFIAHEVSSVVPEAVIGEKDAINEDGSINPQGIDQSKLVPLLTKALQEQQATIEALTARIVALETA